VGRHSAPDDGRDAAQDDTAVLTDHDVHDDQGRHSRLAEQDPFDATTGPIWASGRPDFVDGPPDDGLLPGGFTAEPEIEAEPQGAPAKAKRPRATSGDLTLLRRHSDVRARCAAAVVVPFVVYFGVLLTIGSTGRQMLLFIFGPLILAGVLVGTFLDLGHKKHDHPVVPDAQNGGGSSADPNSTGSTGSR
jgi:hypothetical protein